MRIPLSVLGIIGLFFLGSPAAAQQWAVEQLDESPRHHEWVEVEAGDRTVHNFVAYPEEAEKSPAVIVIHENRGLTDWVRSLTDQLAAAGFLAIAPDLLSEFDDNHQRTRDFESSDAARNAIYELDDAQVISDLEAVQRYALDLPAATGEVAVVGFCWGGSQTFRFATYASNLSAALVFYGSPPVDERIPMVSAPVYGFYGENDERINSTISKTEKLMADRDKTYNYVIYEDVGHAFMRQGDAPDASDTDRAAKKQAFDRMVDILSRME